MTPNITPGEIAGWPLLKIVYRTDPDKIADLLPPGIEPGANAHVHVNSFPETRAQFERGQEAMTALAREAVKLGGTVGAEHGLGKRKAHLLEIQYPPDQIAAMQQVKRRFDPDWLLGQGTLFACPS